LLPNEVNALKRASIYSLPPNELGYCGPNGSWHAFMKLQENPNEENAAKARELLHGFYALQPYLELIAEANNLKPFDEEVIEAYWLGNKVLESVEHKKIRETILSFKQHGLPARICKKKAEELPAEMLPHHSMHVLYINFISQKVAPVVENLSECLVHKASVLKNSGKEISVNCTGLVLEGKNLRLEENVRQVKNPFGLGAEAGARISVHWGNAIELLSEKQVQNLEKYTRKTIEAVNGMK